jgi:1,4-alpha-glucan branching enzyme
MFYPQLLQGYKTFGFQRKESCTVYREWAPGAVAAQLIGDFNGWNGTWMEKNEFGVWSVSLPDGKSRTEGLLLLFAWGQGLSTKQHVASGVP